MRRRRILRAGFEEPPLHLTPLIDVVFVILIMFIVIAPLLESDRIDLAQAPSLKESLKSLEKSAIVIRVDSENNIFFNNKMVNFEELNRCLISAKELHPQAHPQIFHDKKGAFGTYQSIKNAIEKTGFLEMEVVLKPE